MSLTSLLRRATVAAAVLIVGLTVNPASAIDLGKHRILDQTGCAHCCPACDYVCNFDAEIVDEEKTCFDVECKVICIPRVVFPWQTGDCCLPFCGKKKKSCDACDGLGCSSCVNNGARTRRVRVLTTDKYTCPKCKYSWTAEKKPCSSCCDGGGCCDAPGCDAIPMQVDRKPQLLPKPEVEPVSAELSPLQSFFAPLKIATFDPQD